MSESTQLVEDLRVFFTQHMHVDSKEGSDIECLVKVVGNRNDILDLKQKCLFDVRRVGMSSTSKTEVLFTEEVLGHLVHSSKNDLV